MTDNFLASRAQRLIDEFEEEETVAGGIARVLEHLAYAFDMVCDGEGESMVGVPVSTLDQLAVELRNAPQPEPEGPSDEELLALMPETMRDEFSYAAKVCSDVTGGQVKPGIFRVALNTAALEYAQAVLARWGNL
jgi:hypothetical protein